MHHGFDAKMYLDGVPVIRKGDNVFLIGTLHDPTAMMQSAERMALRFEEFRCPFNFVEEFDKWWLWHKRKIFDEWSTSRIMFTMVSDIEVIKAHKIEKPPIQFHGCYDSGVAASLLPRSLVTSAAF